MHPPRAHRRGALFLRTPYRLGNDRSSTPRWILRPALFDAPSPMNMTHIEYVHLFCPHVRIVPFVSLPPHALPFSMFTPNMLTPSSLLPHSMPTPSAFPLFVVINPTTQSPFPSLRLFSLTHTSSSRLYSALPLSAVSWICPCVSFARYHTLCSPFPVMFVLVVGHVPL